MWDLRWKPNGQLETLTAINSILLCRASWRTQPQGQASCLSYRGSTSLLLKPIWTSSVTALGPKLITRCRRFTRALRMSTGASKKLVRSPTCACRSRKPPRRAHWCLLSTTWRVSRNWNSASMRKLQMQISTLSTRNACELRMVTMSLSLLSRFSNKASWSRCTTCLSANLWTLVC